MNEKDSLYDVVHLLRRSLTNEGASLNFGASLDERFSQNKASSKNEACSFKKVSSTDDSAPIENNVKPKEAALQPNITPTNVAIS